MSVLRVDTRRGSAFVRTETWPCATSAPSRFLLIHGNPASLGHWHRIAPRLAAFGDVAALDLPGFGLSPTPSNGAEGLSLESLAEVSVATADALQWKEPFYILGHSHGGGVAQIAAARYPGRIAGIVPMGTLGYPAHTSYRLLALPGATSVVTLAGAVFRSRKADSLTRNLLDFGSRAIFAPESASPDWIAHEQALLAERPEILRNMVALSLGRPSEFLYRSAPDIRCPVLFLHGDKDALTPPAGARSLHERILASGGKSEFVLLPNAGHMLPEFQASEVIERVVAWVRRVSMSLEHELPSA